MARHCKNLKALIADDNVHMLEIVRSLLIAYDFEEVQACRDGGEAIDRQRTRRFDLAVVDYEMSPKSGVDFASWVRRSAESPDRYLPIIMLTGHRERSRVLSAKDAGVNEFVLKPISAAALYAKIDAVVLRPRRYVESAAYFGPYWRSMTVSANAEPSRRVSDNVDVEVLG